MHIYFCLYFQNSLTKSQFLFLLNAKNVKMTIPFPSPEVVDATPNLNKWLI